MDGATEWKHVQNISSVSDLLYILSKEALYAQ